MLIRRKFEYRSTKFEIIPNDKNSKDQNASQIRLLQKSGSTCMFGTFRHSNFEFVSDFDIRISSLLSSQIALKRYNPFNSHQQNRWINEDLKTTLYHGCTNHSKTKQTNQSISSFKPRLCSSLLLRLENPCCPDLSGFPNFAPRHIYEYAYVTKSIQLRVSLRFSAPRYGFYCTICVKIYLIAWIRKGMKSLKHPESMVKPYFHSTTQGKSAKG